MKYSFLRAATLAVTFAFAQASTAHDPRLVTQLSLETPTNGVSTTPEGRLFLVYARVDGSHGAEVVEWVNNTSIPYPNVEWNSYAQGKDPATHLIRINSQRIGPDGSLWLVDVGSPAFGSPVILPHGPKLVQVNLTTNCVQRAYGLGKATLSNSLLDDVRFNPSAKKAYLTDAGVPAIIVLDLVTGEARRLLENAPSTSAYMPVSFEGRLLHLTGGAWDYIYVDQHEVSPDGKWYYFQPGTGGMSRIETKYLNEAFSNSSLASVLSDFVSPFALTPSTGGTAIDARGNIYLSDTDRQSIIKIAPNGTWTTFIHDSRLLGVDAMWVDTQGKLWMPAAQLNRGTPFNNGTSYISKPLHVFTIELGIGPSPIDHA